MSTGNVTDVVIRITADASSAQRTLRTLGTGGFSGTGAFFAATGAMQAGLVALGAKAISVSEQFNDAFSGVFRTVNTNDAGFKNIRDGLIDMSKRLPTTAIELAHIAEMGGQMNVPAEKILGFTETIAKMGMVTPGMGVEAIAEAMGKIANVTGDSDFQKLGNIITAVGQVNVGGVSELLNVTQRIGLVGKELGFTTEQITAWGGAILDSGIQAEMGGSAFSRILLNMRTAAAGFSLGRGPLGDISDVLAKREGSEHLEDLQDNLEVAQEHRAEFFTRRGRLRRGVKPSTLKRADTQIARLQREIADGQDDLVAASPGGRLGAFSELAGISTGEFSEKIKSNPSELLAQIFQNANQMNPDKILQLLRRGGISNIRDIQTFSALAATPEHFQQLLGAATGAQGVTNAAGDVGQLNVSVATKLVTDLAHQQEVTNTVTASLISAGDKLAPQFIQMEQKGLEALNHAEALFGGVDHMVDAGETMFGILTASQLLLGARGLIAGAGAAAGGIGAGAGAAGGAGIGGMLAGLAPILGIGSLLAFSVIGGNKVLDDSGIKDKLSKLPEFLSQLQGGTTPITVGPNYINKEADAKRVADNVYASLIANYHLADSGSPVPTTLGGAGFSNQGNTLTR